MKNEIETPGFVSRSTVDVVSVMGDDESIVRAAVVSTGAEIEQWPEERVKGLIARLMADRHGAPFEHVVFTFKLVTPLFTARQLQRHRIASFNEASGRYRILKSEFYVPPSDRPVRQTGKTMDYTFEQDAGLNRGVVESIKWASGVAYGVYLGLLDNGVAKEVARMVLPVNVMTEMFMTINLRSLFNILSLRGKETGTFPSHPQFEIAELTEQIENVVATFCPYAYEAFQKAGRVQP